jgi:hypothetical protein
MYFDPFSRENTGRTKGRKEDRERVGGETTVIRKVGLHISIATKVRSKVIAAS